MPQLGHRLFCHAHIFLISLGRKITQLCRSPDLDNCQQKMPNKSEYGELITQSDLDIEETSFMFSTWSLVIGQVIPRFYRPDER